MKYLLLCCIIVSAIPSFSQPAAYSADSVQGARFYAQGDSLYKLKLYEAAIQSLEQASNTFGKQFLKGHAKSQIKIATAYGKLGDFQKSNSLFGKVEPEARRLYNQYGDPYALIHLLVQRATNYYKTKQMEDALKQYKEVKGVILESPEGFYIQLAYTQIKIGELMLTKGDLSSAYADLTQGLELSRANAQPIYLAEALNNNARYFWMMGNITRAKDLLQEELDLIERTEGNETQMYQQVLNNMSAVETALGEYDKAIVLNEQARYISEKLPNAFTPGYILLLASLGNSYTIVQEYDTALFYINKAIEVAKENYHPENVVFQAFKNRHTIYLKREQFDLAKKELEKMNDFVGERGFSLVDEADLKKKWSKYYLKTNQPEQARSSILEAIELLRPKYTHQGRYLTDVLIEAGVIESELGNVAAALDYQRQAFVNNLGGDQVVNGDYTNVMHSEGHILLLSLKADILNKMAKKTDSIELYASVVSELDKVKAFIDFQRSRLTGEQFGAKFQGQLRGRALDHIYDVYAATQEEKWLDKALVYSELGRSDQLYSWLKEAENTRQANLPDSLYNYKKSLQVTMSSYQAFLDDEEQKQTPDVEKVNFFKDTLFTMANQHDEMLQQLKDSHRGFYDIMYSGTEDPSMSELAMKNIEANETTIAYNISDFHIYALVIGKDKRMIKLAPKDFLDKALAFREALKDPSTTDYEQVSKEMYQSLFAAILPFIATKKLNIITDGELGYVPLELLMDEEGAYLLEKYDIRYTFSTKLPETRKRGNSSGKLIAFVPEFDLNTDLLASADVVRSQLTELPGAFDEVEAVNEIFEGDLFKYEEATEANFKANAAQHGLIHLATHAIVDDSNPDNSRLAFSIATDSSEDGYLHAYEIYNLDLNADLVTLSACNTGFGKIKRGEGVMSLSRAFAYAGVPATVVSLWPASDKSTPDLMKYFYGNLKEGQTKDAALNNARKEYLKGAKGKARHPFYWGGFILIGDNTKVAGQDMRATWWIMAILVIIVIPVYLKKRKD